MYKFTLCTCGSPNFKLIAQYVKKRDCFQMKAFCPRLWSYFVGLNKSWSAISWPSVPAFSRLLYNGYLLLSRLSPIGCHHQNLHQHQHCDQNPPPPHCNYDQNHFDKITIIAIVIKILLLLITIVIKIILIAMWASHQQQLSPDGVVLFPVPIHQNFPHPSK